MADEIKSLDELKDAVAEAGDDGAETETTIHREPVRDALGRSYATGKRKDAVARVWVKPGNGKITVRGAETAKHQGRATTTFARPVLQHGGAPALRRGGRRAASST